MLSKQELYSIIDLIKPELSKIRAKIKLNPEHPIFLGHFPENPVMPGVASVQIAGELLSELFKKKYVLIQSGNMKFPAVIQPQVNQEIEYEIKYEFLQDDKLKASVTIGAGEKTFVKFNAIYTESERM